MPNTSKLSASELRAILQSQQEAIGHLHTHLEGLATAERIYVPDLNVAVVEPFLGGERVAS